MKLTTSQVVAPRLHRRPGKGNSYKKILSSHQKSFNGSKKGIDVRETSPCDNSDDSGLGIENSLDNLYNSTLPHPSVFRFTASQKRFAEESFVINSKRHRVDVKLENYLNDPYSSFTVPSSTLSNSNNICGTTLGIHSAIPLVSKAMRRSLVTGKRLTGPVTLLSQLGPVSRNGKVQLQILNQPEQQHRARYQTEGSRGAVKDRTGNGFPVVKVLGYEKSATLQVFIGCDQGRVTPHMFYQACRVTGKNSTPCSERIIDGTVVIEIDIDPSKEMIVTCDCVGILKERNVDVEHRFPDECSTRSKKKSTRCRMIFRTVITNEDGSTETLQVASQPIACTQPPGVPEICKKSLTSCSVSGGKELFILGKNFLKDTLVIFQTEDWEQSVNPDKEFLQQTHLVCVVPPYKSREITEPVLAKISVVSGNRASEPHTFTYTPSSPSNISTVANSNARMKCTEFEVSESSDSITGLSTVNENNLTSAKKNLDDDPVLMWPSNNTSCSASSDMKIMPPPTMLPRRSSIHIMAAESIPTSGKADLPVVASDIIPVTTNGQLKSVTLPSNTFSSTSFSGITSGPLIQTFTPHNFHPTSDDVDASLKTEPVVPKMEPLSDANGLSCSGESYAVEQNESSRSPSCVIGNQNKSSPLCVNQSTQLFTGDNFMYANTTPNVNLFVDTIPKTEPPEHRIAVDDASTAYSVTTNPNANLISSESVNFLAASNSLSLNANATMPTIRSPVAGSMSQLVNANFELEKIMNHQHQHQHQHRQQTQQSQTSSSHGVMRPGSFDNIVSPGMGCFKSAPSTTDAVSVVDMYSNYMTMSNNTTSNNSSTGNLVFEKSLDGKTLPRTTTAKSSMILEDSSISLMGKVLSSRKNQVPNSVSFLSSQNQNANITEFVPASLVGSSVDNVPKLENLVNPTADNFIRSNAQSASSSMNVDSNANCASGSIALDTFLAETPRSEIINNVICAAVVSSTDVRENQLSTSSSYPIPCNNMLVSNSNSKTMVGAQMNELNETKPTVVPEMKKTVEGMFSNEISQMTDNDLLSYINPSCFDEGNGFYSYWPYNYQ